MGGWSSESHQGEGSGGHQVNTHLNFAPAFTCRLWVRRTQHWDNGGTYPRAHNSVFWNVSIPFSAVSSWSLGEWLWGTVSLCQSFKRNSWDSSCPLSHWSTTWFIYIARGYGDLYLFQHWEHRVGLGYTTFRGSPCSRDIPPDSQPLHLGVGLACFASLPLILISTWFLYIRSIRTGK